LEIGVDWQIDGGDDGGDVGEHRGASDGGLGIGQTLREGEAGAGGGEGGKAEATEVVRGADVPGIGNHETAALMQLAERLAAGGEIGNGHSFTVTGEF